MTSQRVKLYALFVFALVGMLFFVACGEEEDTDETPGGDDYGYDDDDEATWTDPESGLTWQVEALPDGDWEGAKLYCQNLTLEGGGWHLPTISELRTLFRGCSVTETGGECGVTDSCVDYSCLNEACLGCKPGAGPGKSGCYGPQELPNSCISYWSSSPVSDFGILAWTISLNYGGVFNYFITSTYFYTRCVR